MEEKILDENAIENEDNGEIMVKIENVSKQYRLGMIGGTTLKEALQRWWAKVRKKEDPTRKIGAKNYNKGEKFMALSGVSFEVKKGEAIGLIGHNGAGKSTLLKLLTRVTAPTEGKIYLNGRVASMLEVGTGFHGELTGRENVYMNGAILGMTKKEIDAKIEDIIEFSEVREFIDTPVKRYSSGMFVKLAFSVAVHLDAEIMLMDEVLAVGDINFQQKCIKKMRDVADSGRTIIYVSHNMSTIRQLCDKCVVLSKGQVIYEGDVESAIKIYAKEEEVKKQKIYDVSNRERKGAIANVCRINTIKMQDNDVRFGDSLKFSLNIDSKEDLKNVMLRYVVFNDQGTAIGAAYSSMFDLTKGANSFVYNFDTEVLEAGNYSVDLILCSFENGVQVRQDLLVKAFAFSVYEKEYFYNMKWNQFGWGNIKFKDLSVSKGEIVVE